VSAHVALQCFGMCFGGGGGDGFVFNEYVHLYPWFRKEPQLVCILGDS
jgi:hypothetical protein